jgi:NitT/TauT family transport system permease protein
MVVNTAIGLTEVEPDLLELTRVYRMSKWRVLWRVRLPSALPYVFSGLRVASTLAVIGVIIGEFVGSSVGLGYLVLIANSNMNTALAIAAIILISAFGLALYGAIVLVERLLMPWKPAEALLGEARL